MTKVSTSSKISHVPPDFLSLPRELRNQIYAHVLVDGEFIDLWTCIHRPLSPQLLRTNKAVYAEATEVLYARNRFDFTSYPNDLIPSF